MAKESMDTVTFRARIPPEQIGYVNAILDAHEGIAVMRTRNRNRGTVEFWVAPAVVDDFKQIMAGIGEEVAIEREW